MTPKDNPSAMGVLDYGVDDVARSTARRPEPTDDIPTDLEKYASDVLLKSGLIVDADRALYEEFDALCDDTGRPADDGSAESQREVNEWLHTRPKFALCLSGGGIRSAAFCMGALRALALNRLLPQFHYLSTVSGGGYIAGWLLHLVKLNGYSVAKAANVLASTQALPQVKNLRDFTNFLAPTPGLLSGDAMSGAVLYMRNVIVNWMMFIPAFIALALVPCVYRDAICAIAADGPMLLRSNERILITLLVFALGLVALAWSVFHACMFVPSHAHDIRNTEKEAARSTPGTTELGRDPQRIFHHVVVPALIWAAVVPLCLAALAPPPEALALPFADQLTPRGEGIVGAKYSEWMIVLGPAFAATLVMFLTFVIAGWRVQVHVPPELRADHHLVFVRNRPIWLCGCLVSGAAIAILLALGVDARAEEIAAFGPVLILTAHVLQTTFYVALRRDPPRADLDREWLGRLNAQYLIRGVLFAAWAACALILPELLLANSGGLAKLTAAIGVASGPTAALMARRAANLLKKRDGLAASMGVHLFGVATLIAALLFAVSLAAVLSWAAQGAIYAAGNLMTPSGTAPVSWWSETLITSVVIPILGCLSFWLGRGINVNRFSMHSVYRNRLVRAFLGSARRPRDRKPDSYVRFDPADNPRLSDFVPANYSDEPKRLFPVIGVTLNLVGGTRTAWSERKSAPFTITPLRCGAAELNHPQIADALQRLEEGGTSERIAFGARPVAGGWTSYRPSGAYAKTDTYAGAERTLGTLGEKQSGLTLGTAMALSGAAVSSSMGSHSSSAFAFLLTLFDLRLGMWLPNPGAVELDLASPMPRKLFARAARGAESRSEARVREAQNLRTRVDLAKAKVEEHLNSPKPRNTLMSLFDEMCGNIDDRGEALYLSDGGHFDNLGLYEMLRRRCKCILVVDVSGDPEYSFAELGMAIRRANIDLDACVHFDPVPCPGKKRLPEGGLYATIHYPARDKLKEASGELLVIKPWVPDSTPTEVRAYHAGNTAFPHDSTANQFFAETQFESYRRLGEHVTAGVLGHATDIEKLFASARARKGT